MNNFYICNGDLAFEIFFNVFRAYGDEKHCRKLYRRALERVWDKVEDIGASFLHFEQMRGSLETMVDFDKRYRDRYFFLTIKAWWVR